MSKDTFYFSHDSNAANDDKILALRMKHGWEGYGLFWALIERLRESKDFMSVKDYNVIAFSFRTSPEKIKSIINDFGLFAFTEDGKSFYSERLVKSMELKNQKSEKAREKAMKRWNKDQQECNSNATAMQQQCSSNAIKVKESKVNKSKVNNVLLEKEPKGGSFTDEGEVLEQGENGQAEAEPLNNKDKPLSKSSAKKFSPPTIEEIQAYCDERQNGISAESFWHFYESKGWMVGKNKMKNWKSSIITWEKSRKENGRYNEPPTGNNRPPTATTGKSGKISAHQFIAQEYDRAVAEYNEGKNRTG